MKDYSVIKTNLPNIIKYGTFILSLFAALSYFFGVLAYELRYRLLGTPDSAIPQLSIYRYMIFGSMILLLSLIWLFFLIIALMRTRKTDLMTLYSYLDLFILLICGAVVVVSLMSLSMFVSTKDVFAKVCSLSLQTQSNTFDCNDLFYAGKRESFCTFIQFTSNSNKVFHMISERAITKMQLDTKRTWDLCVFVFMSFFVGPIFIIFCIFSSIREKIIQYIIGS